MRKDSKLLALANHLQACSSCDGKAFRDAAIEAWETVRAQNLRDGNKPSGTIMAALLMNSELVGQLLTQEERFEFSRLAVLALERYEQRTNPSNKLGSLIADILKEL